jgi:hypothetical protein
MAQAGACGSTPLVSTDGGGKMNAKTRTHVPGQSSGLGNAIGTVRR